MRGSGAGPALVVEVRGVGTVAADGPADLLATLRARAFWGAGLTEAQFCQRWAEGEGLVWPGAPAGKEAETLLEVMLRGGVAEERAAAVVVELASRRR